MDGLGSRAQGLRRVLAAMVMGLKECLAAAVDVNFVVVTSNSVSVALKRTLIG